MTWEPQSRLAFGHSTHRLSIGPPALAKPNPIVCSLACRCQLQLALRADQESFSIESGPLLDSKALCRQLRVVLELLYPNPPSILALMTWVAQSRLAFGHSAHRPAIGPPALAKPNSTVCSLTCRWRLWSALWAERESFSIKSGHLLIIRPYYTAPKCPTVVLTNTFSIFFCNFKRSKNRVPNLNN